MVERLIDMSYEERVANPCIGAERADLVLAGCAILEAIRREFPCRRLRVADRGLREGMLVQMMRADGVWGGAAAMARARRDDAAAARDLKTRVKTGKSRSLSSKLWLERQLNDPYVARAKREGLSLARRLQADRDRRQAPPAQARHARGRSRRRARRLEPGRGQARRRRRGQGPRGRRSICSRWRRSPASISCSSIFSTTTAPDKLKAMLGGPADVVLSDMAANATGHRKTDHLRIMALVEAAADFAREVLAPGGAFLCKVLQGGTETALLAKLKRDFTSVKHVKPAASRADSAELYLLATGFRGGQS